MNYNKDKLQEDLSIKVDQSNERYKIVYVDWNGINDVLNISILNYGDVDVKIVDIYVNGNRINSYLEVFPKDISILKICNISFNSSTGINQNDLYDIVIVSQRGISYEYLWRA
jgi:hypothetical protein